MNSINHAFSWGSRTKAVLRVFSWMHGPVLSDISYIPTFLIIFVFCCSLPIVVIAVFYYLQSVNHYDPTIYKTVMFITQIICRGFYIPIMTVLLAPLRCNYVTNELADFEGYKCFDNPNLVPFLLTFIAIICMISISFINYFL